MRIVLSFIILVFTVLGQAPELSTELDAYVESQVTARKFMGSVLVSRDGQVVLKKGYGMANLELDVQNKPETKFRLGSITKQFVAIGILQLEEKGKLTVQDSVCKYVPECPAAWEKVTIHHLLSHTSGIANFTSFPEYSKTWMLPSRPEETMRRFKDKPLDFQPGEKWSYSNSAYIMLGYLLEKISGEKYEDYMRKHILDPAGMADSGHDTHEAILKNRATGYSRGQGGAWINSAYHDMTIPIGGGDLYSTVEDLYKWDQALQSDELLSSQARQKMFTPVRNQYGYGWGIEKQYGRTRYSHGGGINGFATFYARFPEQRAVVAVLGNMDFANSGQIGSNLVRILFGEKQVRPEDRKEISIDSSKLGDYIGQYAAESGPKATISVEGEKLMALIPGSPREELLPEAADRFFYKSEDRLVSFQRGPDGKASGMVVHRQGIDSDWKRTSSEVPPMPKEITLSAEQLEELAGVYELSPAFAITVLIEGGTLFAQATGQPKFELFAEAKDKFFLKAVEAKIEFQRADGKVNQLTLHQGGREMPMKRK